MKFIITIILLLITTIGFSQTQEQNDSLVTVICNDLQVSQISSDSEKLFTIFDKHLIEYFQELNIQSTDTAAINKILSNVYYRSQRNCAYTDQILRRMDSSLMKGDWASVSEKPIVKNDKKICREIMTKKNLKYLEAEGDTVNLELTNSFWIDHFKDGSYSKLSLKWINDCEFEIVFIESNNHTRMNLSKPGDKYRYQILEKFKTYYTTSVEISDPRQYFTFRIYYTN